MNQDKKQKVILLNIMTFAFAFAPLIYYFLANHVINFEQIDSGDSEKFKFMLYVLVFISVGLFISGIMIAINHERRKSQFQLHSNPEKSNPTIDTHFFIACGLVEAICILGLTYYFISGQVTFLNYGVIASVLGILFIRSRFSVDPVEEQLKEYAFESEDKKDD